MHIWFALWWYIGGVPLGCNPSLWKVDEVAAYNMYTKLTLDVVVNINCYAEKRRRWLMQKSVQSSIECSSLSLPCKRRCGIARLWFGRKFNSGDSLHAPGSDMKAAWRKFSLFNLVNTQLYRCLIQHELFSRSIFVQRGMVQIGDLTYCDPS